MRVLEERQRRVGRLIRKCVRLLGCSRNVSPTTGPLISRQFTRLRPLRRGVRIRTAASALVVRLSLSFVLWVCVSCAVHSSKGYHQPN